MIDKILKDIKGLFKMQDKAKFFKQNIPYLAFFYVSNIFSLIVLIVSYISARIVSFDHALILSCGQNRKVRIASVINRFEYVVGLTLFPRIS